MRIVIAGGNVSTLITLQALIRHELDVVGVLGYEPDSIKNVSGYAKLDQISFENNIEYHAFKKINSPVVFEKLKEWSPDVFFVVGLSQLVNKDLLKIPKLGTVGYHPTKLPKGRGRAPISWLILENNSGASNFFLMDEGTDSGPIFVSEPFNIDNDDYAKNVENKILGTISKALDKWLPQLKKGIWNPIPQDENKASYYGKRNPIDGIIDWSDKADAIQRLIRATSKPHPGAYSFYRDNKIVIWKARLENKLNIKGVISRVLLKNDKKELLVQTGEGLIWLEEYEIFDFDDNLVDNVEIKIGAKLGYKCEHELFKLKNILKKKGIL